MKAKLNVGMERNDGKGALTPHDVLAELRTQGFKVKKYVYLFARGNQEDTLAATIAWSDEGWRAGKWDVRVAIYKAAFELHQDCIAVKWEDGTGELIGPKAEEWGEFKDELFVE